MNLKKIRQNRCLEKGFSLLEVLVAVAIFSIGILAIGGLQYLVINGNSNGNVVTQEVMLAQSVLEDLKNVSDPTTLLSGSLSRVDMTGSGNGPYNVSWRISNPALGATGLNDVSRFISVTVTPVGPHGHPITISTLTHGNGI